MLQTLIGLREDHRLNPNDPATMVQLAEALVDYVLWCQDQIEAVNQEAKDLIASLRTLSADKQEAASREAARRGLVGPGSLTQLLIDRGNDN